MLEKCLKANPKHSWAACDLAVIVHTVEKDSDKAEKMLNDVIQSDPKCANAYCNRRFQILHFIPCLALRSLDPVTSLASLAHVCRPIREFLPLSPRFFVTKKRGELGEQSVESRVSAPLSTLLCHCFSRIFARGPMLLVYGFGWWRGICL